MQIDPRFKDDLNFRDLGGSECEDGRKVKEGFFYRGAGLGYFDSEELENFEKLGIRTIMDLRSRQEIKALPDPKIKGAEIIEHSGLVVKGSEDIDWSPAGMAKIGGEAFEQLGKIKGYYQNIAFDNKAFQIMMEQIVKGQVPIYFHCATGKDRTGVAAMLLLLMLGVKKEEIRKNYLVTNVFRKKILEKSLEKVADRAKDHPEIATLITLQDGVVEKTFDIVMDSIEERYGDIESYFDKEFHLSRDKIRELRDRYLI